MDSSLLDADSVQPRRVDIGTSLSNRAADKEAFLAHAQETRVLFTSLFAGRPDPVKLVYERLQQLAAAKRVTTAYEPDGGYYGPAIFRIHYAGHRYQAARRPRRQARAAAELRREPLRASVRRCAVHAEQPGWRRPLRRAGSRSRSCTAACGRRSWSRACRRMDSPPTPRTTPSSTTRWICSRATSTSSTPAWCTRCRRWRDHHRASCWRSSSVTRRTILRCSSGREGVRRPWHPDAGGVDSEPFDPTDSTDKENVTYADENRLAAARRTDRGGGGAAHCPVAGDGADDGHQTPRCTSSTSGRA